ncbi:MAG: tetratricopeptide repeat protein [Bacteroidota bacterium]
MIRLFYKVLLLCTPFIATAQSDLRNAEKHFNEGNYLKAVVSAEQCHSKDSLEISCVEILANAFNKLGDQANAKKYFHKLEKLDSTNLNSYIQLAAIYEQQQRLPRAIKYYSKLNNMLPENPIYFRKNAKLFESVNDNQEAFRLYAQAFKLNPRDILTIKGLAELLIGNNQMMVADSLISSGLEMDSENISLYYLLARSKYKQKQYDSVTFILEGLRGKIDLNSYYNKLLGYSYLQIDSVELAIQKLQLALVDEPESEKLHYYMATAYEKQENAEGALDHYQKAAQYGRSPDLDLYHRNTARIAHQENKYKMAIAHYRDAFKYSEDPVILYYLASISDSYYKDKSIAINYYRRYIKSGHSNNEYQEYANRRSRYLKEIQHQSN